MFYFSRVFGAFVFLYARGTASFLEVEELLEFLSLFLKHSFIHSPKLTFNPFSMFRMSIRRLISPILFFSLDLSMVRNCSKSTIEFLGRPQSWSVISIWVGILCFWFTLVVIQATMVVGLCLFPIRIIQKKWAN